MPKTILITGTSTGFGHDTAETLSRAGHTVFASMREPRAKNREHAETLRKRGLFSTPEAYVNRVMAVRRYH